MFKNTNKESLVFVGVAVFSTLILFFWFSNFSEMIKMQKLSSETVNLSKEGEDVKKISKEFKETFNEFRENLAKVASSSKIEILTASSTDKDQETLDVIDIEQKQELFHLPSASSSLNIDTDDDNSSTEAQKTLKQELGKIIKKI